jgi:hypothetical protein
MQNVADRVQKIAEPSKSVDRRIFAWYKNTITSKRLHISFPKADGARFGEGWDITRQDIKKPCWAK